MRNILSPVLLVFVLWSCQSASEKPAKQLNQFTILKSKKGIKINELKVGEKEKAKLLIAGDTFPVILKKLEDKLSIKFKSKDRYNGMKSMDFWPYNEEQWKTIQKWNKMANQLGLMTAKSEVLSLKDASGTYQMIMVEALSKRILERNGRREGMICEFTDLEYTCINASDFSDEMVAQELSDIKALNKVSVINNQIMDSLKFAAYQSLMDTMNVQPLRQVSYLNPVDLRREPVAYLAPDYTNEKIYQVGENTISINPFGFKFLDLSPFDIEEGRLRLKKGSNKWIVDQPFYIPSNYELMLTEGQSVDIINNAFIISNASIKCFGTESAPVQWFSSDQSAQGLTVLNAQKASVLNYTSFNGLSMSSNDHWNVSGAVVFYQSDVKMDHCQFSNNQVGDDMLNIIQSKFKLSHCYFENVLSDAFDGDFVEGQLEHCSFKNIGNDAIDYSGSQVEVSNCTFEEVEDKAVSAGERSALKVNNLDIKSSAIGIASKDASSLSGNVIKMHNVDVDFTVFCKKKEYGMARVDVKAFETNNTKQPYLLEEGSQLIVNEDTLKANNDAVRKMLYGAEYGKASK